MKPSILVKHSGSVGGALDWKLNRPMEVRVLTHVILFVLTWNAGGQWLSGRVLELRPRGRRFEPHRRHCVVILEQDTFILA